MNASYLDRLTQAKDAIQNADALLIGAGAGLSAAAGLTYSGPRFHKHFADYIARYGLTDMYSSAFHPFPTREEWWGYFSRHIALNRYSDDINKVYTDLLQLAQSRQSFVLTTNADGQFFKTGFDTQRLFATQGDYSLFQCKKACHDTLYDNRKMVVQMVAQQRDCRIPSALLPKCPVCGGPLVPHLRIDGYFVENQDWHDASERYRSFVRQFANKRIVLLELGVGYNTPSIIKYPFEAITAAAPDATLIRINRDHPHVSARNRHRTLAFDEDLGTILAELASSQRAASAA